MNKYTVYTEFMHSKTVYLTFNLKLSLIHI